WLRSLWERLNLEQVRQTGNGKKIRRRTRARFESRFERLEDRTVLASVAVASFFDSAIYEIDVDTGALVSKLVDPNSQATLQGPAGMAVGPDGNLYLSSQFNNSIVRYDVSTDTLTTFISSAVLGPIATSTGAPTFAPTGLA